MQYSIDCPAKLNLFLNINHKRDDGFHYLQSLFCKINLFDTINIIDNEKFNIKIIYNNLTTKISLENNIFTEILNFFIKEYNINSNLSITLHKNIPIGAGLGGGSSDAYGFIILLNKIYNLNLDKNEMQKISLKFGSDIPFFFEKGFCFVEGRGEILKQINFKNFDFSKLKILLIYPQILLPTNNVFNNYNDLIKTHKKNYSSLVYYDDIININLIETLKLHNNDLQESSINLEPIIGNILNSIQNYSPLICRISGSGSSCFGIFDDDLNFLSAYNFFIKYFPNFFIKEVKIINI
jgi:4-diphosphocytidyl-2-C-methyl-D-erythritol kinase